VLTNIGSLDFDDKASMKALLSKVREGAEKNKAGEISKTLGDVFAGSMKDNNTFKNSELIASLSEADCTNIALTMLLGTASEQQGMDSYLSDWATKSLDSSIGLSSEEKVAAAAVNTMMTKFPDSEITKQIRGALGK
jgi:hypothetical protein